MVSPSLLTALWWATSAHAGGDALPPSAIGQGGAVVAHPLENGALGLNPGALALAERHHAGVFGVMGEELGAAGNVVDSRSARTAVGVSYRRRLYEPPYSDADLPGWAEGGVLPPNEKRVHDLGFGLAWPFADQRVSVGLSGALVRYNTDRSGTGWSGDVGVGLAARPHDLVTLGLSATNLLPLEGPDATPARILGGVRVGAPDRFWAEVDGGVLLQDGGITPDLRAGVEGRLGGVELRGGWRYAGEHRVSAGIGSKNETGAVEYAIELPLREVSFATTVHSLGLRIYLPEPSAWD